MNTQNEQTLIANTGIQIIHQKVRINLQNIREKMYFREWFDISKFKLSMELVHYFSDADIYVKKHDLWFKGFMPDGIVNTSWEEICKQTSDIQQVNSDDVFMISGQSLMKGSNPIINKFLNVWLPMPYFEYNTAGKLGRGPFNWTRIKVIPTGNVIDGATEWDIAIAVDTRTIYDHGNYSDEYKETPLFPNEFEQQKRFGACDNDIYLLEYCSSSDRRSEWIDKYVLNLVHQTRDINNVTGDARFTYLVSYMCFINLLRKNVSLPDLILFKDRNVERVINVNLVVDMGNSKTTAILAEEGRDFTSKTKMLQLQNFTEPQKKTEDSFDMNVAFQKADFGDMGLGNSQQFVFPSFLRLGEEARYLMYHSVNEMFTRERLSVCSSPKRYLWDTHKRRNEWEYVRTSKEAAMEGCPIWVDGISEQLNEDGTLSQMGSQGANTLYSRRSLMTLSFLEILAQARMQINGHEFRQFMGDINLPRRVSKILVTCPTAMSRVEQLSLRMAAEEAFVIMERFLKRDLLDPTIAYKTIAKKIEIVPSILSLKDREEHAEWTYDEASCSQFVFLCAEIAERYANKCEEYFNLYGKVRSDLPGYTKNSLTIGSLDIGAGTSDLMISAYKYDSFGQTSITPVPLFWESFYIAGDDMLKDFVQQIVIEGPFALVSNRLKRMGKSNITQLLADFFEENNNRQSFNDRMTRKDFNLQVSVPIALKFMEAARQQSKQTTFVWADIFSDLQPSQQLLDRFFEHFGFRIEEAEWNFVPEQVDSVIVSAFDGLLRKVAAAMKAYKCDIVILSGRPASLKQIENLFLKYYPVSPNRLKVLNNYRVGRWYPFQNGDGYFTNQKSIVAVGALLGYRAATQGGFNGLSLNLSELQAKLLPTTEYFGVLNTTMNTMESVVITPEQSQADILVNDLPLSIGTRQLNTTSYPVRSFYQLDFNTEAIAENLKKKGFAEGDELEQQIDRIKQGIRKRTPLKMRICREDYVTDKETLIIDSVVDAQNDDAGLPVNFFSLQIKSLSELNDFWLDSGAFKLSITTY